MIKCFFRWAKPFILKDRLWASVFCFRVFRWFSTTLPAFSGQKQCRLANDRFRKSNCGMSRWSAVIFGCIVTIAQNTSMIPLWINLPWMSEGMKTQTVVPVNKIGFEILNAQKVKLHRSNPLQIGIVIELQNARKVRAQPLKGQAIIRQFKRRTRH